MDEIEIMNTTTETTTTGIVYMRLNEWYIQPDIDVIKLGITAYAKNRNSGYITGEPIGGHYVKLIEIPLSKIRAIDNILKYELKQHHKYRGRRSGIEFYDKCILSLVEPILRSLDIPYRVLSKEEMEGIEIHEYKQYIKTYARNQWNVIRKIIKQKIYKNRSRNCCATCGGGGGVTTPQQQPPNKHPKYKKAYEEMDIEKKHTTATNGATTTTPTTNGATNNNNSISISNEDTTASASTMITIYQPNTHQTHVLNKVVDFYQFNDIGKIIWACGLGKALLCIFMAKVLKYKTIVIGVPSVYLQEQMKKEIIKLFPNTENILFVGGDGDTTTTTNKNEIKAFITTTKHENETPPRFIITTYHSCYLLVDEDIHVDFKIGDEAHHLVGAEKEEERGFRLFHKIQSTKTLFMTATEKTISFTRAVYSMDDEAIFGKYIDVKTVHWAIENKHITDYRILVLKNTEEEVDGIIRLLKINVNNNNKEIFISAYMSLKSIEKYRGKLTHLLLYTNTTEDAELAKTYIDAILELDIFDFTDGFYNNALYSKNTKNKGTNGTNTTNGTSSYNIKDEILKFKNAPCGIISCVFIFGEGFDLPKLNGVCIAGNMKSEIRIVQYLLRPNRLEKENPEKIAYVILPYIDNSDDWEINNNSFEKVRTVVSQMRNVDEIIEQKICVVCGGGGGEGDNDIDQQGDQQQQREGQIGGGGRGGGHFLYENSNELEKLKIRLRFSKGLGSKLTEEQDEYNYVRSVNHDLYIQSKPEYIEKQQSHCHYIPNPEEYFKQKGVWVDWYDFMGVNRTQFIQTKELWLDFCKSRGIRTLEDYIKSCDVYRELPKEPAEFYGRNFTNIQNELGFIELLYM